MIDQIDPEDQEVLAKVFGKLTARLRSTDT